MTIARAKLNTATEFSTCSSPVQIFHNGTCVALAECALTGTKDAILESDGAVRSEWANIVRLVLSFNTNDPLLLTRKVQSLGKLSRFYKHCPEAIGAVVECLFTAVLGRTASGG